MLHLEAIKFSKTLSRLTANIVSQVNLASTFTYFSAGLHYGAKAFQSTDPIFIKQEKQPFSTVCEVSNLPLCPQGSGLLRARAGGHEEDPAADRRQPAGVEAHRGRAAAGVSDPGGGAPEDAREAEDRAGQGDGGGSGKPGEVPQAAGVAQHVREHRQGQCETQALFTSRP